MSDIAFDIDNTRRMQSRNSNHYHHQSAITISNSLGQNENLIIDDADDDSNSTDALLVSDVKCEEEFDNNNDNHDDDDDDDDFGDGDFVVASEDLIDGNITQEEMEEKQHVNQKERDYDTFIWHMPQSFEKFFMPFDDAVIRICQRFHSKPVQWFSKVVSAFSTIEIGMTVPFLCFLLGWDAAAQIWLSFALALAIIPQLPKRFIWRPRPYMAGRAKKFGKEHTSSFPSRAVTCSVLYAFVALFTVRSLYLSPVMTSWSSILFWVACPILITISALMTSFSRINLGVHYPSDCLFGVLQGLLCCFVGLAFYSLHLVICPSCVHKEHANSCYASPGFVLHDLSQFNWMLLLLLTVVCTVASIVLVVRPINFYTKFHHIFGMILPCEVFQLCILCKSLSLDGETALAISKVSHPSLHTVFVALSSGTILTLVGIKTGKGNTSILIFLFMYLTVFGLLFFWRVGHINDFKFLS